MQKIVVTLESENSSVLLSSTDMPELDRDKDVEIAQLTLDLQKANNAILSNAAQYKEECEKIIAVSNQNAKLFNQSDAIRIRMADELVKLRVEIAQLKNKITNALDNLSDD
jgi:hypothetical protein